MITCVLLLPVTLFILLSHAANNGPKEIISPANALRRLRNEPNMPKTLGPYSSWIDEKKRPLYNSILKKVNNVIKRPGWYARCSRIVFADDISPSMIPTGSTKEIPPSHSRIVSVHTNVDGYECVASYYYNRGGFVLVICDGQGPAICAQAVAERPFQERILSILKHSLSAEFFVHIEKLYNVTKLQEILERGCGEDPVEGWKVLRSGLVFASLGECPGVAVMSESLTMFICCANGKLIYGVTLGRGNLHCDYFEFRV
jgi:hypothetical protein